MNSINQNPRQVKANRALINRWNRILASSGLAVVQPGDMTRELSIARRKRIEDRTRRHLKKMKKATLEHQGGVRTPSVASKAQLDRRENEPIGAVGYKPQTQTEGLNPGPVPQAEKTGNSS